MPSRITVQDTLDALNRITGGRVVTRMADLTTGRNPFVVTKSSHIPGKGIVEIPGLICGDPDQEVRRLAVTMTLTESAIELAAASGVDCIVAHHPVADAANSGGVPMATYLSLYGIALIELHEAFHGLHPGIPLLHGHRPIHTEVAYAGIPGNVMVVGEALPGIACAGDILTRIETIMAREEEERFLELEREFRGSPDIEESQVSARPTLLLGRPEDAVRTVLHVFPHTGFSAEHLERALRQFPEIDTLIVSISRVRPDHPLVGAAKRHDLTFIVGNSHNVEIMENGLPLAYSLQALLPSVDVRLFRERVTSIGLGSAGGEEIRRYAQEMAERYLVARARERLEAR